MILLIKLFILIGPLPSIEVPKVKVLSSVEFYPSRPVEYFHKCDLNLHYHRLLNTSIGKSGDLHSLLPHVVMENATSGNRECKEFSLSFTF